MYTEQELLDIVSRFDTAGKVGGIKALGPGFINDTFIVTTTPDGTTAFSSEVGKSPRYILQRKNHIVFPDVPGMMHNIDLVTAHIRAKVEAAGGDPLREVLTVTRRRPESITS